MINLGVLTLSFPCTYTCTLCTRALAGVLTRRHVIKILFKNHSKINSLNKDSIVYVYLTTLNFALAGLDRLSLFGQVISGIY